MPFVKCRVNRPIDRVREVEIKSRLGRAIEHVPGKSEEYLLVAIEADSRLWLRGDDARPVAYIEAAIFGNEGHRGYPQFTAEVTRAFGEVLGIPPENVYIRFEDIAAWSVGGQYIDRSYFR